MGFFLRPINESSESELDLVTKRAMETVLETCPEFQGDPTLALKAFSNFTHEQMKTMFKGVFGSPNHVTLLAIDDQTQEIIGHSIFSVKIDNQGKKFGFCYSRYVRPESRRKGIASALLNAQEKWWREKEAQYAIAQTHETNVGLQELFKKHGFEQSAPIRGKFYTYFELRKSLG